MFQDPSEAGQILLAGAAHRGAHHQPGGLAEAGRLTPAPQPHPGPVVIHRLPSTAAAMPGAPLAARRRQACLPPSQSEARREIAHRIGRKLPAGERDWIRPRHAAWSAVMPVTANTRRYARIWGMSRSMSCARSWAFCAPHEVDGLSSVVAGRVAAALPDNRRSSWACTARSVSAPGTRRTSRPGPRHPPAGPSAGRRAAR